MQIPGHDIQVERILDLLRCRPILGQGEDAKLRQLLVVDCLVDQVGDCLRPRAEPVRDLPAVELPKRIERQVDADSPGRREPSGRAGVSSGATAAWEPGHQIPLKGRESHRSKGVPCFFRSTCPARTGVDLAGF